MPMNPGRHFLEIRLVGAAVFRYTEALLATADTALYQAKRAGRSRVILTGDSGPSA